MRLSAIVSTYDRPAFLERALWGWATQTRPDFELVIADDGSGPETAALIERMRSATKLDLVHVRHEDRGFRKTEILNRAIVAASGDWLMFSDGDCIPRDDLVATHYDLARPRRYLAGGYIKLPAETSDAITAADVRAGRHADLAWLRAHGFRPGRRALRMMRSRAVGALLDRTTPTPAHFAGNNASVARDAIVAANGFEGEMGYGGLDRALGYRLENLGVKGMQVRHRAVTMHLHHDQPYRRNEIEKRNNEIMAGIRANRETRARQGIAQLAPDPSLRVNGRAAYEEKSQ